MSIVFLSLGLLDVVCGAFLLIGSFPPSLEKIVNFFALALILKGLWSVFAYFAYHD